MRQTASRAFGLASLARSSRKQSEDAATSFAAPSARLLISTRATSAPSQDAAPCSAVPPRSARRHSIASEEPLSPAVSPGGARWKTFSSLPTTSSPSVSSHGHSELPAHRSERQQLEPPSPSPVATFSNPGAAAASFSSSSAGREPLSDTRLPRGGALTPATTGVYNEPKDASFSGRIVQHDGNHAVHLLVAGTGSRDYNLRMVRCHVRDELHFGGGGGGGGGPAATGAICHTGMQQAVLRGEDVSFPTFLYRQVRDTVGATFLPAGYPATTGPNYVKFTMWQGVNNIAVTANSVLASTFMLYAVGLGAGSIPTAGALNWVLKDGMGQLGTLLFGKTIAHNFDVHSKTWFFLSAVMLQAAAALELLTVLAPGHFLLMGSLANTLKGLAWMAAGSTRSVFHLSFARDNNIADVTAKGTSQYILASLVGTAGGALMCAAVGQSGAAAGTCFGLLSAAAVGSAYMAVQAIPLTTLNATRLQLLVEAFLDSISPSSPAAQARRDRASARSRDGGGSGGGGAAVADCGGGYESDDDNDPDFGDVDMDVDVGGGVRRGDVGGYGHLHGHPTSASLYDRLRRPSRRGGGGGGGDGPSPGPGGGGGGGGGGEGFGDRSGWRGTHHGRRDGGGFADAEEDDAEEGEHEEEWVRRAGGRSATAGHGLRHGSSGAAAAGGGGGGGAAGGDDDGGGGGIGASGTRRWFRPRRQQAYRTVDRCYIGPSVHEFEMMYDDSLEPRVPTPLELSPMDPPLPYFSRRGRHLCPPITVGSRLEHVVDGNAHLLVMLLSTYKYAHFMVLPRANGLHVVLHEKADPRDMVQAYLQACILRRRLVHGSVPFPDPEEQTAELRLELQESLVAAERLTTIFMSTVEANGWTVAKIVVEAQRRRARW